MARGNRVSFNQHNRSRHDPTLGGGAGRTTVAATRGSDEAGDLRIDFESTKAQGLERISWEQFFGPFEESKLAFLYQEQTDSEDTSRFFKLVRRD